MKPISLVIFLLLIGCHIGNHERFIGAWLPEDGVGGELTIVPTDHNYYMTYVDTSGGWDYGDTCYKAYSFDGYEKKLDDALRLKSGTVIIVAGDSGRIWYRGGPFIRIGPH